MSVQNLPLPETPELIGEIEVDSIKFLVEKHLPNLEYSKSQEIIFRFATLIGFKDLIWQSHFEKSLETLDLK
jgi:hypothetical protein